MTCRVATQLKMRHEKGPYWLGSAIKFQGFDTIIFRNKDSSIFFIRSFMTLLGKKTTCPKVFISDPSIDSFVSEELAQTLYFNAENDAVSQRNVLCFKV